jgi:uncharacterized protein (DUF697 family)
MMMSATSTTNSATTSKSTLPPAASAEPAPGDAAPQAAAVLPDQNEVDAIIRNRVYASLAIGLVPLPLIDAAAQTAVQTELLYRLAQVYGVPFKDELGKKAVSVVLGSVAPVFLTPGLSDLARYVPLIGAGLSATSWPITLGASTYALGRVFAKHFASGGTLLDCDFAKIKEEVTEGLSKAKDTVKGFVKKDGKTDSSASAPAAAA